MQQLFEKKRRRRESHNAVERRRRDNINERINDLATLLPDRDATKLNKGTILRKSVDHIRILHERLSEYQQRIQELESVLSMYRGSSSGPSHIMDQHHHHQQQPIPPPPQQQHPRHPHHHQHHQDQQVAAAAAAAAAMIPSGHPLDLSDMQPHLGGSHDPFQRDE